MGRTRFTYSKQERELIKKLNSPAKVQEYLNQLTYNWESGGETIKSFRQVIETKSAHCLEATFFAAAILYEHGYQPLVLDIESVDGIDHCMFLYQENGKYGVLGVSREPELYGKLAQFDSVHDLVMSYFDDYIDYTGCISGYAVANLDEIPFANWRFSRRNIWKVQNYLIDYPHRKVPFLKRRYERAKRIYIEEMKNTDNRQQTSDNRLKNSA